MFKTIRDAELLPNHRTHPDAQFWSYVELGVPWPWFHVSIIQENKRALYRNFVFAPSIPLLQDLLNSTSAQAWIEAVYVVSPGDLNGTDLWKMDLLSELSAIVGKDGDILGHNYRIANGPCYSTLIETGSLGNDSIDVLFSSSLHLGSYKARDA